MDKEILKLLTSKPEVIEKFSKDVMTNFYDDEKYWKHVCTVSNFDDDFIKENIENVNIKFLIKYQSLSPEILNWLSDNNYINDYNSLIEYQTLSENIIRKYFQIIDENNINWNTILRTQSIPEDILEKYVDKWDWNILSQEQFLTIFFIAKHHNKIVWNILPTNLQTQYLFNDSFVLYFQDKDFWDNIGWMDKVSLDMIWQFIDRITEHGWYSILEHKNLSHEKLIDFVNNYLPNLNQEKCWHLISCSQNLAIDFIDLYQDKLIWDSISLFQKLDYDTIIKYQDKISFKYLTSNDCFNKTLACKLKDIFPDIDPKSDSDSE